MMQKDESEKLRKIFKYYFKDIAGTIWESKKSWSYNEAGLSIKFLFPGFISLVTKYNIYLYV